MNQYLALFLCLALAALCGLTGFCIAWELCRIKVEQLQRQNVALWRALNDRIHINSK